MNNKKLLIFVILSFLIVLIEFFYIIYNKSFNKSESIYFVGLNALAVDSKNTMHINRESLPNIDFFVSNKESNNNLQKFNDKVNLNLFDYFFRRKNKNKERHIELYNLGINFYKKRMDLIHVFTLLLITERILLKRNK